jgi:hypothetical protein
MSEHDEVLVALVDLVATLEHSHERVSDLLDRANLIMEQRREHVSYRAITAGQPRPLLGKMAREYVTALLGDVSRFRRAEAGALDAEGMSVVQIAELFGVTRQRVSALLRDPGPSRPQLAPGR